MKRYKLITLISFVAIIMTGSLVYKDKIVNYIYPSTPTSISQSTAIPTPSLDSALPTAPAAVPTSEQTPVQEPTLAPTPAPAAPAPSPTPAPKVTKKAAAAPAPTPTRSTVPSQAHLTADQQHMLDLINQERSKAGVGPLKIDAKLQSMAQAKSADMVAKAYFNHTSPTYGSPFDMMNTFGISYSSAGENIAGNSSVDKAHVALMNSPGHKENILKASYNYIGIGITASPTYGEIFAQDFIGR